jgi:hypothetical protein
MVILLFYVGSEKGKRSRRAYFTPNQTMQTFSDVGYGGSNRTTG